jgi:hypothetical protein
MSENVQTPRRGSQPILSPTRPIRPLPFPAPVEYDRRMVDAEFISFAEPLDRCWIAGRLQGSGSMSGGRCRLRCAGK